MRKLALVVTCLASMSASADQFTPDPIGVEYLHRIIHDDIDVFQSGGKSLFTWAVVSDGPFKPSVQKTADRAIDAWFAGETPPPGFTSGIDHGDILLFQMYWAGTQIPKSCAKDSHASRCDEQTMAAIANAQRGDADFMAAYNNAREPMHLSTFLPAVEKHADKPQRQSLPLPHPQALVNADRQCDDFAFSSGNKRLGEACKRRNHRGLEDLTALRDDPEIKPGLWAACNDAVGFEASADYAGWARCVRFVRKSCPASSIRSDGDLRRCLRAIQSDGWIVNSSSD